MATTSRIVITSDLLSSSLTIDATATLTQAGGLITQRMMVLLLTQRLEQITFYFIEVEKQQ